MAIKGSCLCKGVQYEIDGPIEPAGNCHCSMCRKSSGAAFMTGAGVKIENLRWTKGEDLLTRYESSPGGVRVFCGRCGSSFGGGPADGKTGGMFWIMFGTLDDDPGIKPSMNIYVGSKAPWYDIADGLPQRQEFEK